LRLMRRRETFSGRKKAAWVSRNLRKEARVLLAEGIDETLYAGASLWDRRTSTDSLFQRGRLSLRRCAVWALGLVITGDILLVGAKTKRPNRSRISEMARGWSVSLNLARNLKLSVSFAKSQNLSRSALQPPSGSFGSASLNAQAKTF
jgi:hypothetical protein